MKPITETLTFGYTCKHSVRYNALKKDAHLKSLYISNTAFVDIEMNDLPATITVSLANGAHK